MVFRRATLLATSIMVAFASLSKKAVAQGEVGCSGAACRLEVRGGVAILHVAPSVYRAGERIGAMKPRDGYEAIFSVDSSATEAYERFVTRARWHRWLKASWIVTFLGAGIGYYADASWANEVTYASMAFYGAAFVPGTGARSAFREAVARYNAALDGLRGAGSRPFYSSSHAYGRSQIWP